MQDRTIPDGDISASSSWSDSTAARHSRYLARWGWPGGNSWGFYLPLQPLTQVKRLKKERANAKETTQSWGGGALNTRARGRHRARCSLWSPASPPTQAGEQRRRWGMVPCRASLSQGGGVPAGGPEAAAPGSSGGHPGAARWGPGQGVLPQLPAALFPGWPPLDGLEGPLGSGGEASRNSTREGWLSSFLWLYFKCHLFTDDSPIPTLSSTSLSP